MSPTSTQPLEMPLTLSDQYDKTYKIEFDKKTTYIILFKADKKIGSEGVKWTRALNKKLSDSDVFFPILEMKNTYPLLPLFMKKYFIKSHLNGEFYNPAVTDKEPGEMHPALILDWENEVAKQLSRTADGVWVLKFVNGKEIMRMEGDYSEAKLNQILNH